MTAGYPTATLATRDRRWRLTEAFLAEHELDCLLVFGLKGRERFDGYLANEVLDGVVVFPRRGDPVYLTWTLARYTRRLPANMQDVRFWIDDVRIGPFGPGIVSVLTEKGLGGSRVGVVGLASWAAGEMEGIVTHMQWDHVLTSLPDARFQDCSIDFSRMMLPKSPEDLELLRCAADAAERACRAMLDLTRPGVREAEIYAEIMSVLHRSSAVAVTPHLIMSVGADDLGWAPPYWTYAGGPSRTVRPGDLVQAEIMSCYGGFEAQVQMSVAVEPVPDALHGLHDVARRSYEAGLATLRPGARFLEVAEAMAQPLRDAGLYSVTPMVHSLSPAVFVGHIALGAEQIPGQGEHRVFRTIEPRQDLELKPGMAFAFEPNACTCRHRVNIGGTVVVGEPEPVELNTIPRAMHVVS